MADKIIYNAKVYVERGRFAEAVLVRGDKIAAVGTNDDIKSARGAAGAEKIDAEGGLLLPGFNDSHMHLHEFGRSIHRINAFDVTSVDELAERGRELINRLKLPKGSVVTGFGWNEEQFTGEKRHLNRHDMDRISTDHAIIIDRVCGHSVACNSLAIKMAGITRDTPQIEGGHYDTDENGEPVGIFRETAINTIKTIVPPYTQKQINEQILHAMRHALERGLTSVSSCDIIEDNFQSIIDAYVSAFNEGGVRLRINSQSRIEKESSYNEFIKRGWVTKAPMGHPYITSGPVKLFADGSLGSRTAYLRSPYRDEPSVTGLRVHRPEEMNELVRNAHNKGFQVAIHAIGDGAVEDVINAYVNATGGGRKNELRHGVIHCQITDMPLLRRMADNDILAIVQPAFLAHDLYMVDARVGKETASTSYAFATMEKLGIKTSYGTDSPVESMSPVDCIDCAVNRLDFANGYPEGGFYPQERVDAYTAVDNYTAGSAYATFTENQKGRIRADMLADMTLLDRDIFTIPKREIHTAKTLWTMVGGDIAYRRA